jgi:membrane protein YqaA with SNARE-associated domain
MRLWLIAVAFSLSAEESAVWSWLHRLGGVGLVLLGLADNSAIPLPGSVDVFTILLSAHKREWWPYYAAMATVGAVLGGYLTYRLAQKGGEQVLEKKIGKRRAEKVYKKFEKQGGFWVFVGAILPPPFPMVPVLMAAGILEYPKKKFLAVLALGRGVRYFAFAWIAHIYGAAIVQWLTRYYEPLLYALITLAVLGAISAVGFFEWYLPRKKSREQQQANKARGVEHKAA